ncbi:RHS repeat-associated core domain-containing protein [Microbispora sp. NPDC049125]|uniref:RHS repeat-associated core domain-containing protein n=1 Tax=Microbispora sp. NPDC049125 TaxID=3154929 RepID=UPI003466091A
MERYIPSRRKVLPPLTGAVVCLSIFVAGVGVPDGLVQKAAAEASSSTSERSVDGHPVGPKPVPKGAEDLQKPIKRAAPTWPQPGTGRVDLSKGTAAVTVTGLPVSVAPVAAPATLKTTTKPDGKASSPSPSASAALQSSPSQIQVETFDNAVARRLGGVGVAVRLTRGDGSPAAAPAKVTVDYSSFGNAYSGGFASRLTVLKVPACLLDATPSQACAEQARAKTRTLPVINDVARGKLTAVMDAAAASAGGAVSADASVYVLASSAASTGSDAGGSFAATDLKPSGTWQVGLSGGDFSYSYPISAVPPPGGSAPALALRYSSSSVDSLTSYTNNQAPLAGLGWDLNAGFIERQFESCGLPGNRLEGHLCWHSPDEDPASSVLTLSVGGRSSQIVREASSGTYKTVEDFGWKIAYLTSGGESGQPYWQVTTQDGTIYRFGYHRDSSWQVPVLGDNANEPCHAAFVASGTSYPKTPAFCSAPWRWQLDREIDPKGNVIDYTYGRETNTYCRAGGTTCTWLPDYTLAYDRGGYLSEVTYGHNVNVAGSTPTGKIAFNAVDRGTPPAGVTDWEDDTPTDLWCADSANCGHNGTPTFFTSKRLDSITSQSWNTSSSQWEDVTRLNLTYKWIDTDCPQGSPFGCLGKPVLWLDRIQPVGMAGSGPDIKAPPVDFSATMLDNRADYVEFSDDHPRFRMPRISALTTGLGGATEITYGQANPCDDEGMTGWDVSAQDCYGWELYNYTFGESSIYRNGAIYNKWLVMKTTERDLVAGSPDQVTQYQYVGSPAWAKPVPLIPIPRQCVGDAYLLEENYPWLQTCDEWPGNWTEFRGYQTVRVIKGTIGGDQSQASVTATSFYRGLYEDTLADGSPKHTTVTDFDGTPHDDLRAFSGRTLQEQTMRITGMSTPVYACTYSAWRTGVTYDYGDRVTYQNHHWEAIVPNVSYSSGLNPSYWTDLGPCPMTTSVPNAFGEEASTRYEYENVVTGTGVGIYDPHLVNQTRQVAREKTTSGWRYTEAKTTYNADGLPTKVNDYGERGDASDNTCTATTYARNTAKWLINYTTSEEEHAGDDCSAGTLLSRTISLYDGATSPGSNTPTRGDVTEVRSYSTASDYSTNKSTYDSYGRPLTSTDPMNKTTFITYTPAVGWPSGGVTVINPLSHTVTTWSSPYTGQPVGMRDANGNDVNIDYDALGRTLQLWTPDAPKPDTAHPDRVPAAKVAYTIPMNADGAVTGPASTAMSRLQSGSGASAKWVTTYSYEDGLGRPRESQAASPAGGRIVQVTTYDGRGLQSATTAPVYNSSGAGSGLLNPVLDSLLQWSKPEYDALGRTTAQVDMSKKDEQRRTTTNYLGADKYEVTPPVGGKTVYYTDAADQVTKIEEWLTGGGTGQQGATVAGPAATPATATTAEQPVSKPVATGSPAPADALVRRAPVEGAQASREAAASGKPVEVASLTTADSSTVANANGSYTTTISSAPVRVKRGNAWTPIDTTLTEKDGVLAPNAGPQVEISTGGTGPFAKLTDETGKSIELTWPTALPRPSVAKNVATFVDAAGSGADLVVTALPTGLRHDVVLRKRPDRPVEYRVSMDGELKLSKTRQGGFRLSDAKGKAIAPAPDPVMYSSGGAVGKIDTRTENDGQVLVLRPDAEFLTDPNTVYPVTVDPTLTLTTTYTTSLASGAAYISTEELGVGNLDLLDRSRSVQRSFLQFDTGALAGASVQGATLTLQMETAYKCIPGALAMQRITSNWDYSTRWSTQPSATTTGQATQTDTRCPNNTTNVTGSMTWTVTSIVQAWASGTPNYGFRLIGTKENTTPFTDSYKRTFSSYWAEAAAEPQLSVTYTPPPPPTLSNPTLTPATQSNGTMVTSTLTPTMHATVTDPVGGTLKADYEVEHDPAYPAEGTGSIWTGTSAGVSSGQDAPLGIPSGKLTDGWHIRWRARATNTGSSTSSAWSAWQTATVTVPDPVVDQLQVTPSQTLGGAQVTSTLTPALAARATTPAGGASRVEFEVEHDPADTTHGTGTIWTAGVNNIASGNQATVTVPAGKLADGWKVRWRARAVAAGSNASAWTAWQGLTVTIPAAAVAQLQITPSQVTGGTTVVSSLTPQLLATVTDSYGAPLRAEFEVEHDPADTAHGTGQIWTAAADNVASGTQAAVTVPGGKLVNGWGVRWRVRSVNTATQVSSAWTDWQLATIDAGNVPADPAVTALQITPSQVVGGSTVTPSLTPHLLAQVTNPAGGTLRAEFEVEHDPADTAHGTGSIWTGALDDVPAETQASVAVPDGALTEGWTVRWRARALAGSAASAWSDWQTFRVDLPDPVLGALQVTPSQAVGSTTVTSTLTPQLLAQMTDPAGGKVRAEFEVEHDPADTVHGTGSIWTTAVDDVTSGTQASVTVPDGKFGDGWLVRWRARAVTPGGTTAWSAWQPLTVVDASQLPVVEGLRTQPSSGGTTSTLTPALIAKVSVPQGGQLGADFQVEHDPADTAHGTGSIWTTSITGVSSGSDAAVTVPAGKLAGGWKIRWRARATRGGVPSDWASWQTITVSPATHYDTTYEYDRNGRLTKQTDANGNVRTFTYDLLGRRTAAHDPDAGNSNQAYDDAGRLLWATNGKGEKISYSYDDLGRKTAIWSGETETGTKLAEWVYDTLDNGKGKLTAGTRYVDGNAYVDAVTGYDRMNRPIGSKVTIPSSEGLLAGTYVFSNNYTATGAIAAYEMPAAGGLPQEKVVATYSELGLPQALTSNLGGGFTYVDSTSYKPTSKLAERAYGAGGKIKRVLTWDDTNGWVNRVTTTTQVGTSSPHVAQDDQYFYNTAGAITRVLDAASTVGAGSGQSECFTYDGLRRLAQAWTTTATDCVAGPTNADGLGIDPYTQSYTYDGVGNITSVATGGQTSTYSYPEPGDSVSGPNAVTAITHSGSADAYVYDTAGRLTSRTVAGKIEKFDWNGLGQLEKATIDGQDTTMVYDADGDRLIRRDPDGKSTLYLGSMEIEATSNTISGKRYYTTPDGATVAMRVGGSGVTWLMSGLHGSTQLAIDDATGRVSRERYLPYGQRRGSDDLPFTDHGFLGKVEDGTTGLDYLSARYYDPEIGRFVSPDPLLDLRRPQWANPYEYAGNNPIGMSDPTGLGTTCDPQDKGYKECRRGEQNRRLHDLYCKNPNSRKCKEWRKGELKRQLNELRNTIDPDDIPAGYGKVICGSNARGGDVNYCETVWGTDAIGGLLLWYFGVDAIDSCLTSPNIQDCFNGLVSSLPASKALQYFKTVRKFTGCSSFVPGTSVLMANGSQKPIEEVEVGDTVLATDPITGSTAAKTVIALSVNEGDKSLVKVTLRADADNSAETATIISTAEHAFWASDQGHWLPAYNLTPGMRLRSSASRDYVVSSVKLFKRLRQRVHNLTIEGFHTYYVIAGTVDILVHNASGCWATPGGPGSWGSANESMSARAAAYQMEVTGVPHGMVYWVNGVKFDGYRGGVLMDAKGPGYAKFVKNGRFQPWYNGADDLVAQAQRQLQAAHGTPVVWYVAEKDAMLAMQNLFASRGIKGITLVHQPVS